jgi:hypothetical protein
LLRKWERVRESVGEYEEVEERGRYNGKEKNIRRVWNIQFCVHFIKGYISGFILLIKTKTIDLLFIYVYFL